MKILSNPNVQNLVSKAFIFQNAVKKEWDAKMQGILKQFNLATSDDVNQLKRKVQNLQANVDRLKKKLKEKDKGKDKKK